MYAAVSTSLLLSLALCVVGNEVVMHGGASTLLTTHTAALAAFFRHLSARLVTILIYFSSYF